MLTRACQQGHKTWLSCIGRDEMVEFVFGMHGLVPVRLIGQAECRMAERPPVSSMLVAPPQALRAAPPALGCRSLAAA